MKTQVCRKCKWGKEYDDKLCYCDNDYIKGKLGLSSELYKGFTPLSIQALKCCPFNKEVKGVVAVSSKKRKFSNGYTYSVMHKEWRFLRKWGLKKSFKEWLASEVYYVSRPKREFVGITEL